MANILYNDDSGRPPEVIGTCATSGEAEAEANWLNDVLERLLWKGRRADEAEISRAGGIDAFYTQQPEWEQLRREIPSIFDAGWTPMQLGFNTWPDIECEED